MEAERLADRAAVLLARPNARLLQAAAGIYVVRASADRRRRALLMLDDEAFALLAADPGLSPLPDGGWRLTRPRPHRSTPKPGRPGVIEARREVAAPEGHRAMRTVNLGESPIAWLARRRDGSGAAWLSPPEIAAAEKLREDFTLAGTVGRLTMAWDAGPKARGGRGPGVEPAERGRAAKDRIAQALTAVGPGLREILEHVCFAGTALEAAERDLGLPRRSGKAVLKLALQRLAGHYGILPKG